MSNGKFGGRNISGGRRSWKGGCMLGRSVVGLMGSSFGIWKFCGNTNLPFTESGINGGGLKELVVSFWLSFLNVLLISSESMLKEVLSLRNILL
jgi:hypothetical protein